MRSSYWAQLRAYNDHGSDDGWIHWTIGEGESDYSGLVGTEFETTGEHPPFFDRPMELCHSPGQEGLIDLNVFNSGGQATYWDIVKGALPPGAELLSSGFVQYDFSQQSSEELDELAEDLAEVIMKLLRYLSWKK